MSVVEPDLIAGGRTLPFAIDAAPPCPAPRWKIRLPSIAKLSEDAGSSVDPLLDDLSARLSLGARDIAHARQRALANGTDLAAELIANRVVGAEDYARGASACLGIPVEAPGPDHLVLMERQGGCGPIPGALETSTTDLEHRIFFHPRIEELSALKSILAKDPALAARCRVTTEAKIRERRFQTDEKQRLERATLSLSAERIDQSARIVLSAGQGAALALLLAVLAFGLATRFWTIVLIVHLVCAFWFTAWVCLRAVAAFARHRAPPAPHSPSEEPAPIYTVVVPLHHEHEMVAALVANLDALDWPKSRTEIFLVCEADDHGTIEPCRRHTADKPQFCVVTVPPGSPRTKPKALNHVLPIARGRYLVLYDAEDRPHPGQLVEASDRYRSAGERLACLQSPLVVTNGGERFLPAVFAMEYAAQFRALLPFLAGETLPVPLGGTSNHFRVDHLRAVGGWDSHNVTEDADLGIRLGRQGYEIGTLSLPTFEEAPETLPIWFRQRTRWLKGWLQTYAVHMRDPVRLYRELGFRRFAAFQLIFHGMVSSALLFPFAFLFLAMTMSMLRQTGWPSLLSTDLLILDMLILAGGYGSFVALVWRGSAPSEWQGSLRFLPLVPLYWLLVSAASYRAVWQLFLRPHDWEKTPHGLAARADKRDPRHRIEPIFDIPGPSWEGPEQTFGRAAG
ncbi:glycosyltransferase family 2 protein [Fulvimarina endophytica]|uniref:glycosyltransferase family 2 protein n=1 Tax=Fulvimarina endophytica TaxID=2293836 RepID=UPI001314FF94|nr:glycosyltransferase [Fulvimarina endophytica]